MDYPGLSICPTYRVSRPASTKVHLHLNRYLGAVGKADASAHLSNFPNLDPLASTVMPDTLYQFTSLFSNLVPS